MSSLRNSWNYGVLSFFSVCRRSASAEVQLHFSGRQRPVHHAVHLPSDIRTDSQLRHLQNWQKSPHQSHIGSFACGNFRLDEESAFKAKLADIVQYLQYKPVIHRVLQHNMERAFASRTQSRSGPGLRAAKCGLQYRGIFFLSLFWKDQHTKDRGILQPEPFQPFDDDYCASGAISSHLAAGSQTRREATLSRKLRAGAEGERKVQFEIPGICNSI